MRKIFLPLLIGVLSSCSPFKPAPSYPPGTAPPSQWSTGLPPAQFLLERVQHSPVRSIKGMAKVRITSPVRSGSFSQIIAAREPSFLRLESLGPLGHTFFILTVTGKNLEAYSSNTDEFYTGASNQKNISRLLPFPVPPETFVSIALGKPPVPMPAENSATVREEEKGIVLTFGFKDLSGSQSILFSRENLMPLAATTYDREGVPLLFMTLSDYKSIDGTVFPIRITLSSPAADVHASITYTDVSVNSEISDDLFSLQKPHDAISVPLDEQ